MPIWGFRMAAWGTRRCRPRAPQEPGNCGIALVTGRSSLSPLPMIDRSRGIWKRHSKRWNCGLRPILGGADLLDPQNIMGGLAAAGTGRLERGIEQSQKSIEVNPDFVMGYTNLARNYFHAGRFGEAENTLQAASARKLESSQFLVYRYNIAFLTGDDRQMNQVLAMAKGKRGTEHWVANSE